MAKRFVTSVVCAAAISIGLLAAQEPAVANLYSSRMDKWVAQQPRGPVRPDEGACADRQATGPARRCVAIPHRSCHPSSNPMRFATVVLAVSIACVLSLAAQSPAGRPEAHELADALPGTPRVDQFVLTADRDRTYFVNSAGEAWLFDHTHKTSARLAAGPVWDLNLSPTGDALAYTRAGDQRGDQFVWMLPLNRATGIASGGERRVSPQQGSVPSISPDGKFVAFARDEATGAGQSVVVAPAAGGAERVVARAIPSSLANIRWTPDRKTLYLGVNPPVACVPEWSCLPLNPDLRQPPGTIRRVAVSGGDVTTVTTARGVSPGLSPDGTTLMYLDASSTSSSRRYVVANADGTRRDTITLPPSQTPAGWLRGSTLLISDSAPPAVLTMDLSAARVR
jgi:hypothetical protein